MKKLLVISPIALIVSFAIFSFMAMLIQSNEKSAVPPKPIPIVSINMTPKPMKTKFIVRALPKMPEPPASRPTLVETPDNNPTDTSIGFPTPSLTLTNNRPNLTFNGTNGDSEAAPIMQIQPNYPPTAARDGIEGWVLLSFSINEIGSVINVKVLNSSPKRTFDKEARKALKRWKYKPKFNGGAAMTQHNQQVRLDFTIDK